MYHMWSTQRWNEVSASPGRKMRFSEKCLPTAVVLALVGTGGDIGVIASSQAETGACTENKERKLSLWAGPPTHPGRSGSPPAPRPGPAAQGQPR